MAKEINTSKMDSLLKGLTGGASTEEEADTVPENNTGTPANSPSKKEQKSNYEVISTMVDPVVISKVRAIAATEGLAIKDVIGVGLKMVVGRYEEVHGKIRMKKTKKGNVDKIFNI